MKMRELHFLLIWTGLAFGRWQDGAKIYSHLSKEKLGNHFLGSFGDSEDEHLSLLKWNTEYVLIGGRDAIFNLSAHDLSINSILNWTVSPTHQEMCQLKGQKDSDCHNFIRLFHGPIHHHHARTPNRFGTTGNGSDGQNGTDLIEEQTQKWIICGTNAFKPLCRLYDQDLKGFSHEFSGLGYSPFDPRQRSTSLLHHGAVYAATVADFGGSDALIYKSPLRTEQHDVRHLNNPTFVSSLTHDDLALFFFRELAMEHTNCGKAVYSRVARICRHDSGSKKHKDRFTTFLKARLNCSVPGEFPFYFDHIQGTSTVFVDETRKTEMLYAVFTTGENSIGASAICAFSMSDIVRVFEGPFKGQVSEDSNWMPVPSAHEPSPRPGSCTSKSYQPDAASVAFHKAHPLMDEAVQGSLILVYPSNDDRFRVVEVDPSGGSDPVNPYHVLYVGTQSGKVLKVIVNNELNASRQRRHDKDEYETQWGSSTHYGYDHDEIDLLGTSPFSLNASLISASWQVSNNPIKTLKLLDSTRLAVGTETGMILLQTKTCAVYKSCADCIRIRDPHCFWDLKDGACVSMDNATNSEQQFDLRQDLENGDTQFCPTESTTKKADEVTPEAKPIECGAPTTKDECCPCAQVTTMSPAVADIDIGDNNILDIDTHFRYASGSPGRERSMTFAQAANVDNFQNIIERIPRKDHEYSSAKSSDDAISRGSIAMATVGSAFLALLIGLTLGFTGSRWLASKKSLTKPASTTAQLAASIHEQSQRLTSKPIDFTLNMNSWNGSGGDGNTLKGSPPKVNLSVGTLEKTVKKIYI